MQPSETPNPTSNPEEERPRWLLGLVPYGRGWYRSVMALGTATVLMGGAVHALMPELRTWPLEQFHIASPGNTFAPTRLEVAEVDLPRFSREQRSGPVFSLARPDGARLLFSEGEGETIRVMPAPEAEPLPDSGSLRSFVLPAESTLPEVERESARRRIRPSDEGAPALASPRGRSISGSAEEGAGPDSGMRQTPLIGARHEYEAQVQHEVVGNQIQTFSTQGTEADPGPGGQGAWGGGGVPPRERLITGIRMLPDRIDLEVGTSQAYDLQIQLDNGQWFSVTHWPETRFRLLAGNGGIEQHRQADNVLLALLQTPERLHGSEVLFEGSLRLPGRSAPLTARALVRVYIPQADRSDARRPGLGSSPRTGR